MSEIWKPVTGDFNCPGRMSISADEIGITIGTGRRALATSEWPNDNIRLCEKVEEPNKRTITTSSEKIEALEYVLELAKRWCSEYHTHYVDNQRTEECSEFEQIQELIKELK